MEKQQDFKEILDDLKVEVDKCMKKYIKLGMEMQKLKNDFYFPRIVKCVKGDLSETYSVFEKLKPLYDEYGYKLVNDIILEISEEQKGEEDE